MRVSTYVPILDWGRRYSRSKLGSDVSAALIVTIMLIPQSLAYALLAGLPPEVGLYASILPLVAYAIFGTSTTLAVGPVAVVSLMTAAAIGAVAAQTTASYMEIAITLALMSGVILAVLGFLRLGLIANFLSHPVISGFISASAIIIAVSQFGALLGIPTHGHALPELVQSIAEGIGSISVATLLVGAVSLVLLYLLRRHLRPALRRLGVADGFALLLVRAGPVAVVLLAIGAAALFSLDNAGVALVGEVPGGLPPLAVPSIDFGLMQLLLLPALVISLVGYVESVSVAQTLAARRRERIDPNQELIGLGAANVAAAFGGGYPVTGGFARSVVNYDAGAATPAAGAFTAIGIAAATLVLTPILAYLPKATLAAIIVVAVLGLVDFSIFRKAFVYSKADFAAVFVTLVGTLAAGVEIGIILGVSVSILIFLYRSSNPHAAIVGRVPGTEHYRNVRRHEVETVPGVVSLRVDESLYFANARYLEDLVYGLVAGHPEVRHVVLMCPAVSAIDMSALESLEAINARLRELGVGFHLSEVKGPVMDHLAKTDFVTHLNGHVFLTQHQAMTALAAEGEGPPPADQAPAGPELHEMAGR